MYDNKEKKSKKNGIKKMRSNTNTIKKSSNKNNIELEDIKIEEEDTIGKTYNIKKDMDTKSKGEETKNNKDSAKTIIKETIKDKGSKTDEYIIEIEENFEEKEKNNKNLKRKHEETQAENSNTKESKINDNLNLEIEKNNLKNETEQKNFNNFNNQVIIHNINSSNLNIIFDISKNFVKLFIATKNNLILEIKEQNISIFIEENIKMIKFLSEVLVYKINKQYIL
jgi:hypothetical protein